MLYNNRTCESKDNSFWKGNQRIILLHVHQLLKLKNGRSSGKFPYSFFVTKMLLLIFKTWNRIWIDVNSQLVCWKNFLKIFQDVHIFPVHISCIIDVFFINVDFIFYIAINFSAKKWQEKYLQKCYLVLVKKRKTEGRVSITGHKNLYQYATKKFSPDVNIALTNALYNLHT